VSQGQQWESETVAPPPGAGSKLPLVGGIGVGIALAAALAFAMWPASEGRVVFELEPGDAEVAVLQSDGPQVLPGGAAAVTAVLEAGSHRAEITADGYEPAMVDFEVVGGELATVSVALEVASGAVEFAIEPAGAFLEITPAAGGDPRALPLVEGRWEGELELGDYVAHVSAKGHHDEKVAFAVTEGDPTLLPVSLRPVARSSRGGTVVVPTPGYRGPGYYGPRYYGPGYYGPRYRRPRLP